MTSGRFFFFFINKCELYIIVKKKRPLLVVLIHFVYGRMSERKERKKIEKINFTFSLSGWAMPFQRRGPRLWEVLTLSLRPWSHRPRKNIPQIPPPCSDLRGGSCAAGSRRYCQTARDAVNLNQRRPRVRLGSKEKHWQICCFKPFLLFPACVGCCVLFLLFFFLKL